MTLSVVLWAFGLATSLFLLGMWGRTVVVDSAAIAESTHTIIDADIAAERISAWFEEGLVTGADVDSAIARSVVQEMGSRPEYQEAVEMIVAGFVDSLFADDTTAATVDLEAALGPVVPILANELARRDVPVEVAAIDQLLNDAGVIDLDAGEAVSAAAVVTDARVFLSQVVIVSLVALLITGLVAAYLAHERLSMVRTLFLRIAVAAMSYAVILRLAGWALDPQRGRSPIAGGASVLLKSNAQVFLVVGALAAMVSVVGTQKLRRRKVGAGSGAGRESRTADDDTRELMSV